MLGMGYAMMGTAIGTRREGGGGSGATRPSVARCSKTRGSRGARGILINITGSSRLGLHEVNEACSLIREAAECDDVQINFGVVLNEAMADAVKITVIATGFQPENAPIADRRRPVEVRVQHRLPEPLPPPVVEPEPVLEPLLAEEPEPVLELDMDDLEVPAYLRHQGRLLN